MELTIQQDMGPVAARHIGKNLRRPAPQLRGKTVLQGGIGVAQGIQSGGQGVIFRLLLPQLCPLESDLPLCFLRAAQSRQPPLYLRDLLLQPGG